MGLFKKREDPTFVANLEGSPASNFVDDPRFVVKRFGNDEVWVIKQMMGTVPPGLLGGSMANYTHGVIAGPSNELSRYVVFLEIRNRKIVSSNGQYARVILD